jgi:hypothetical protein
VLEYQSGYGARKLKTKKGSSRRIKPIQMKKETMQESCDAV